MKKIIIAIACAAAAVAAITSCKADEYKTTWEDYKEWRETNQAWVDQQEARVNPDGQPMFSRIVPPTNRAAYLLKRQIGQTHPGNLQPLFTSTVAVNYEVHTYNDTLLDKGTEYITTLSSQSLIDGWSMAITTMNVGDSAEFIMPYQIAYGASGTSGIPPFTALRFNIRLTDVTNYETRP